jgi:hypothetical protein
MTEHPLGNFDALALRNELAAGGYRTGIIPI